MKTNLIIGAGQLGSRHLQGMLKWEGEQKIYIVDPFEASLNTTLERSKEVDHNHDLVFTKDLNDVPEEIDLAIIATQSNIREAVITNLLSMASIKYLILEKVLFQEIDSYFRVKELLKNTKTWVNHPRRMFKFYEDLYQSNQLEANNKIYSVHGNNWGLGCNGLHFIDLITYLSKSKVKNIDTDWIDKEIQTSKRNGYIEFTGTLKGELFNGDKFIITSNNKSSSSVLINVLMDDKQMLISEGTENISLSFPNKENAQVDLNRFEVKYQSYLTLKICEDLFEKGKINLPTYEDAMDSHLLFINAFLDFMNAQNNTNATILPIT